MHIEFFGHEHEEMRLLKRILEELRRLRRRTPRQIQFKEITMLEPVAGNTLVYTGTLTPAGSAFPAGTTFTVTSNYPNVTPTVDSTGLVVTIPLGSDFVDDPKNPLSIHYETSSFTPEPSSSPSQLTADITPTIPVPVTPTPTAITFAQTT